MESSTTVGHFLLRCGALLVFGVLCMSIFIDSFSLLGIYGLVQSS